jgi:hypothetical protein
MAARRTPLLRRDRRLGALWRHLDGGVTGERTTHLKAVTPESKGRRQWRVSPLSPTLGAELEGFDLTPPLSDADKAEISALFTEHKVLFFRNQVNRNGNGRPCKLRLVVWPIPVPGT